MIYSDEHYTLDYFYREFENCVYSKGFLRIQDQFAALCYAHGIQTYSDVEKNLNICEEDSLRFGGNIPHINRLRNKTSNFIGNNAISMHDSVFISDKNCYDQIKCVDLLKKRIPKKILEIGGGRGELSLSFAQMGYPTIMCEPAICVEEMIKKTKEIFNTNSNISIFKSIFDISHEDKIDIDTIIFCSSIEHIYKSDLEKILNEVFEILIKNKGMLIVVNTITNHPINGDENSLDHVVVIDDNLFEYICSKCKKIIFKEGSHLVLDF